MSGIADFPAMTHQSRPAVRPRVAALIDTGIVSGPGRQLAALAGALTTRAVDLHIVTFQRDGAPPSEYVPFLSAAGIDHTVVRDHGRFDYGLIGRVRAILRELEANVLQTHSYRPAFVARALRVTGTNMPWIAFFHGVTHEDRKVRFYNWLDRRLMAGADRIVVMSEVQLRMFWRLGGRVSVIHNAVVQPPPSYQQAPMTLPATAGHPRIGCIGRLSAEKGLDVMLEALAILHRQDRAAHLIIAGDGPERPTLEARAHALQLDAFVHFLGTVQPISALYSQLDVVAIPSRTEGLPNVLLEALAADRPVVCTPVGAIPEVLTEQAAGWLVAVGDGDALAKALGAAFDAGMTPEARAARRRTVDRFSLESRVQAHVDLYASLLAART